MSDSSSQDSSQHSNFFVWAHRGASHSAPENTLAAFQLARDLGADGIELDVHLSRDGVPVVIHDETLERTTDGTGPVAEWTLEELQTLDAGEWFDDDFRGEPLPTLAEALDVVGSLWVNVEIKSAAAAHAVLELLTDRRATNVLVSSFNHDVLAGLRAIATDLPLGFLCDSLLWRRSLGRAVACRAASFHPRINLLSRPLVNACHRHGLAVYPWTVDDAPLVRRCLRHGIDGLFTNDPASIQTLLDK